jgi:hypothetical protein
MDEGNIGRVSHWLAISLAAALATSACSDDGGNNTSGSGGTGASTLTLEQACADSCEAQARTNCPGVFPVSQCTQYCIDFREQFPSCAGQWRDINACMATAPLQCDTVNGGASVSSTYCGAQINGLNSCMSTS